MSYIKNNYAHRINPTGHQWVAPGQVVLVSDEDQSAYDALSGVEASNVEDYNSQREAYDREKTALMKRHEAHAEARAALQNSRVSAPLQVVHGDDEAPFGPPTGTISTKSIEAAKDEASRKAFADGEALEKVEGAAVTPSGKPNSPAVHNEQVEAKESVDAVAQEQAQEATPKARKKPGPKPKNAE
jgi:hypothetical protein